MISTRDRLRTHVERESLSRRSALRYLGATTVPAIAGCTAPRAGTERAGEAGSEEDDEDETTASDASDEGVRSESDGEAAESESDDRDDPGRAELDGVTVHHEEYDLVELPYERWPQYLHIRRGPPYCDLPDAGAVEEMPDLLTNTVERYDVEDDHGHHPLRTGRAMMRLLHCYRASGGDERYLEKAESMSEAVVDVAVERDGAMYVPYGFDWPSSGGDENMRAPWYGGMGQGPVLSAYVHFYDITGDERYRDIADRVFRSYTNVRRTATDVWTTIVTDEPTELPADDEEIGYFWIEEYPKEPPSHVLNGFIVGLYGLYDYWLRFGTSESETVLQAALKTIEDHVEAYREPGEISWYAMNRAYRGNDYYHSVHIHQLETLHELSGADHFREMAETFREDHPYEEYRRERSFDDDETFDD